MPVYSRYIRTSGNNRMAILASWRTDIFTAYKKPGIFAVSCVLAYRQSVGIFKHVGFLQYVRRSVNSRYIRRRTIVRLWVMGVQWIWDYCWHIAGIFADILTWRRIYQEYVGVFRLQCLNLGYLLLLIVLGKNNCTKIKEYYFSTDCQKCKTREKRSGGFGVFYRFRFK